MCSYYFSYFAFNVNKHVQTIYLLLWIHFDVNYIYLQIHHHHRVDMLWYKTCLLMSSIVVYNELQRTHIKRLHLDPLCELWYSVVYIHIAADWTFHTPPPNKRKLTQTLLHTASMKHVVQPRNSSKTLGTGVNLNVPLWSVTVYEHFYFITIVIHNYCLVSSLLVFLLA